MSEARDLKTPAEAPKLTTEVALPDELPILPNEHYVLFPGMIAPMVAESESEIALVADALSGDKTIGLFADRPSAAKEKDGKGPSFGLIHEIGTAALILKMLKMPEGGMRLLVQGLRRVRIKDRLQSEPYLRARIEPLKFESPDDDRTHASMKSALNLLKAFVEQTSLPDELLVAAANVDHPGRLADLIGANLALSMEEAQKLLEIEDPNKRLIKVQEILTRELDILALSSRIQTQVKTRVEGQQRKFYLREQLKAIQKELGEGEEEGGEPAELKERVEKAKLPEAVKAVADKEIRRLASMAAASPEYTVSTTYLDWILALPWTKRTRDNIDLKKAHKVLDEDHFGLKKVKDRILEFLAVIKLRKTLKGPILCLVGPPGTGKTSLGRSVARSMGRKFARLSLGGMRDEAEIRGHRRTYIGSMPGRILTAMKECGTINPVIMFDELDKLGSDFRGDPASALLEVLDPAQNHAFSDRYLDIAYDLSNVLFIATANLTDTIPGPLLDRMEVLRLSGYTLHEKVQIAKKYLIPRAIENSGLKKKCLEFTEEGIETIVERYTREAGLRNLEREINNVCRKAARRQAEGAEACVKVDAAHVRAMLGPPRFDREDTRRAEHPGVAIGLAWTPSGGDILFIEATATPGTGQLTLTGQLGDVMKESAQAALTYLRSKGSELGIKSTSIGKRNVHVHVPAGAIPKDGPSAGVAMMMAMASLFLDRPLLKGLAMTGEITLKGSVLPVGGIKEKVLAAHRSGVRTLILPGENERDLEDIPEEIRRELDFHFVESADAAFEVGFPKQTRGKGGKKSARRRKSPSRRTGKASRK